MSTIVPNYFSPIEFRVAIKRLPNVEFFAQQSSIPSISTSPIVQPTRFNPVFQTPSNVTYSNLDLVFIIDEDMNNYVEIFDWIVGSAFPSNHSQYEKIQNTVQRLFSDITITVMNSKKNSNILVKYINCFPTSLSDVSLNVTDSDVTYPQATATFQYDSFTIEKIPK